MRRRALVLAAASLAVCLPLAAGAPHNNSEANAVHAASGAPAASVGPVATRCLVSRYDAGATIAGVVGGKTRARVFLASTNPPIAAEVDLSWRHGSWRCTKVVLP